jgi:hypothetical protein
MKSSVNTSKQKRSTTYRIANYEEVDRIEVHLGKDLIKDIQQSASNKSVRKD